MEKSRKRPNTDQRDTSKKIKFNCQQCEHKTRTEIEAFYKKKLDKANNDLKMKVEELRSFKARLAASVSLSIKASGAESLNSPVTKSRLVEVYDDLKLLQWPKVKDDLKRTNMTSQSAQALIQKTFQDAAEAMKTKKKQMEEMFELSHSSSGLTPQKVEEYKQLSIQNLQMALYHSSKEDLLKTHLPEHGNQYAEDVMVKIRPLISECYWLGCLMAFINPPLLPDWKNHQPGMDPWDIFPQDVKPSAAT